MRVITIAAQRLLDRVCEFDASRPTERKWLWMQKEGQIAFTSVHRTRELYRGQPTRHVPCKATICRDIRSPGDTLADLSFDDALTILRRITIARWFANELNHHPFFQEVYRGEWYLDPLAIAQHYGLQTAYLDLTEALDVALFFATCTYDGTEWIAITEGEGILYVLDVEIARARAKDRLEEIGLLPFPRPYQQWAWTFTLALTDFEYMPGITAVVFDHSASLGEAMLQRFNGGELIFPQDPLASIADRVRSSVRVPRRFVASVAADAAGQLGERPELILNKIVIDGQFEPTDDEVSLWTAEDVAEVDAVSREHLTRFRHDLAHNTELILVKK